MGEQTLPQESPIQEFYRDASVFITGATGFIGVVLLEKLLRSCPGLAKVYVMVRAKKGKTMHQRFKDLLDDPVFSRVKQGIPEFEEKVIPIQGDCNLPGLGLSDTDRNKLVQEVHVVFHLAATVNFNAPLRMATTTNVLCTRDLLALAREMKHVKALAYVSTAFAQCPQGRVEERFYQSSVSLEDLLALVNTMDDKNLDLITPKLIGNWPNTYTFTKAVAEDVINNEGKGLPICIVRPSIVINAAYEPEPGWTNSGQGILGGFVALSLGLLRTLQMDCRLLTDVVPVDMVGNAIISAAWDIATNSCMASKGKENSTSHSQKDKTSQEVKIYNYVSSLRRPVKWDDLLKMILLGNRYASKHSVWYPGMFITKHKLIHQVQKFFLHFVPAVLVDTVARITRREPKLMKIYKKINYLLKVTNYFCINEWLFLDHNVENMWEMLSSRDKKMFPFDISEIHWEEILPHIIPGLRVHVLKETVNKTKDLARRRRLKVVHYLMVTVFWVLIVLFLLFLYKNIM